MEDSIVKLNEGESVVGEAMGSTFSYFSIDVLDTRRMLIIT
jgi:hypothetical protein